MNLIMLYWQKNTKIVKLVKDSFEKLLKNENQG